MCMTTPSLLVTLTASAKNLGKAGVAALSCLSSLWIGWGRFNTGLRQIDPDMFVSVP